MDDLQWTSEVSHHFLLWFVFWKKIDPKLSFFLVFRKAQLEYYTYVYVSHKQSLNVEHKKKQSKIEYYDKTT